jgi:hypothetical protein
MNPLALMRLSLSTASLWWEASRVIGMRMVLLSTGGDKASEEYARLIPEKVAALIDAQLSIGTDIMLGRGAGSAHKTVSLYRRRVRSNYRRLLRH